MKPSGMETTVVAPTKATRCASPVHVLTANTGPVRSRQKATAAEIAPTASSPSRTANIPASDNNQFSELHARQMSPASGTKEKESQTGPRIGVRRSKTRQDRRAHESEDRSQRQRHPQKVEPDQRPHGPCRIRGDVAGNVFLIIVRGGARRGAASIVFAEMIQTKIIQQATNGGNPPQGSGNHPEHGQQQRREHRGGRHAIQTAAQDVRNGLSDEVGMPGPQEKQLAVGHRQHSQILEQPEQDECRGGRARRPTP